MSSHLNSPVCDRITFQTNLLISTRNTVFLDQCSTVSIRLHLSTANLPPKTITGKKQQQNPYLPRPTQKPEPFLFCLVLYCFVCFGPNEIWFAARSISENQQRKLTKSLASKFLLSVSILKLGQYSTSYWPFRRWDWELYKQFPFPVTLTARRWGHLLSKYRCRQGPEHFRFHLPCFENETQASKASRNTSSAGRARKCLAQPMTTKLAKPSRNRK